MPQSVVTPTVSPAKEQKEHTPEKLASASSSSSASSASALSVSSLQSKLGEIDLQDKGE
jgi:hypothetical protein